MIARVSERQGNEPRPLSSNAVARKDRCSCLQGKRLRNLTLKCKFKFTRGRGQSIQAIKLRSLHAAAKMTGLEHALCAHVGMCHHSISHDRWVDRESDRPPAIPLLVV